MGEQRSWVAGVGVAIVSIAAVTLLLYALDDAAPVVSLGVVYLLAVLLVSTLFNVWLGILTALGSALAFNYFHIPPTGRFTIADGENWVALVILLITAVVASAISERARRREVEAEHRRREADLAAEMARLLLRGPLEQGLPVAAHRLAQSLGLPSAAIETRPVAGDDRTIAFPLREGARQIGTLLVPKDTDEPTLRRLQERVVPALEALLAGALERDELLTDVVQTEALRRSDVIKTALLRAVSHDLRTPLTAIRAAADPLLAEHVDDAQRRELATVIEEETERLSRLIYDLLDLSRLEADAATPRLQETDIDEVIHQAIDELHLPADTFSLSVAPDLPHLDADPVQLSRAIANLLANAQRYGDGHPVSVRAREVNGRLLMRIVDRGPGIPSAQLERVFEPFYRAGTDKTGYRGSGLGLAIARGFIEANGGRVWAESLPHQGTSFVLEFPLAA
jgi:two-component system, OmpR family, sensor histidine kinase KdpD